MADEVKNIVEGKRSEAGPTGDHIRRVLVRWPGSGLRVGLRADACCVRRLLWSGGGFVRLPVHPELCF